MFRAIGNFFLDILEVVVFAFAIFLFLYLLVLQPHKIKGDSMQPNFPDQEYLLTDKVTYRFNEPKRGDVIVFKPPINPNEEFIKRIIGLPGETVMIKGGHVYVNDKLLPEKYLKDTVVTNQENFLAEGKEFTVPKGEYFVLGDNRPVSSDSRAWGPITKAEITGKAWLIYYPFPKFGTVKDTTYDF